MTGLNVLSATKPVLVDVKRSVGIFLGTFGRFLVSPIVSTSLLSLRLDLNKFPNLIDRAALLCFLESVEMISLRDLVLELPHVEDTNYG
jgi:hypothetical protein